MNLKLIPKDTDQGFTPYLWLIYLGMFLFYPFASDSATWVDWTIALVAIAIFVPLYFLSFWIGGWKNFWRAAVPMALLGFVLSPVNPGASVFWIYAAATFGYAHRPKIGIRLLIGLVVAIGVHAVAFDLHPGIWVPGLLFSAMIGAINIHFGEVQRKNLALRKAHAEVERLAQEAERERIARDLHDLLGHTLSVIVLKSELASKLTGRDPERAAAEIREVEEISRKALTEVRQAVQGYRSSEGDSAGDLAREIENARRAFESAKVHFEVDLDLSLDQGLDQGPDQGPDQVHDHLDSQGERVLAFALREAVTNVLRHSGASSCRVRLFEAGRRVHLEVLDNGTGGNAPEGSGLAGMRERVESVGGRLRRDGSQGTRLEIALPFSPSIDTAGAPG